MEIELSKIAYIPRLDDQAFAANLLINGEKVASVTAKNGVVQVLPTSTKAVDLLKKAEAYVQNQEHIKFVGGAYTPVKLDLSSYLFTLFDEYLRDKEQKKFNKRVELLQKKNIVIGVAGKYTRNQSLQIPVEVLLHSQSGITMLAEILSHKVLPSLSGEEKILNTNIPLDILSNAGLTQEQHLLEEPPVVQKKSTKKSSGLKP